MMRSVLLFLIVLLTAGLLIFAGGTVRTLAANPLIDCTTGANETTCTIVDSAGIGAVQVEEATAEGPNLAVDESYSDCPTEVSVSWMAQVPNYSLLVSDCGGSAEEIVSFDGLLHQPLGTATLRLGQANLAVGPFGPDGNDGVGVELGEASLWSALLLPQAPASGGAFEAAIFSQGLHDPVAEIQFSMHMTDVIVYPSPSGRHDVALYDGDSLVYRAEDVPDGSSHVSLLAPFCEGMSDRLACVPRLTYRLDPAARGAYWEIALPQTVGLMVPTGLVEADRLRFTGGAGARYPFHFHTVQLTGTAIPGLTIFDAAVQAPLPGNTTFLPALRGGSGPADPFGFDALTTYMESDPPVGDSLRLSDNLIVRVVGTGELIDEMVVEPDPGTERDVGLPDPEEPETVSPARQTLRVFNTTLQKEFEIEVGGDLLAQLSNLVQGSGARPPIGGALGVDGLLVRDVRGLSDGVDNRVHLTGTTWWPWRTIVHFSNNCSGTLVGPRHILTAAHCINKRGTNQWYSFTATPGRNGAEKPFGDTAMNPNPQPGDPFRWYFTPAQWRDPQYNDANCGSSCFSASQWDWGLIIIPEYLGYQTGWMGFVARPASQLNYQAHFNRGYPACNTGKPNIPDGCNTGELYGDTQICSLGNYSYQGSDGWNRLIRNSCDISGGHSGSAVYHYYYDPYLGQSVPVVAMVEIWEHCYTCGPSDDTPNTARRLTPSSVNTIVFFRQWKP